MSIVTQMRLFLEPRSLAFIGASRRAAKDEDINPVECLLRTGYPGKIYPVNPNASEVLGLKCYRSIGDVPGEVDLAVVSLPRELIPQAVRECTQKGIRAIIIYTMGLADSADEQGHTIQAEAVRIAREGGARIVGPNTFGVINTFAKVNTYWAPMYTDRALPLGAACQSGIFSYRSWPDPPPGGERMAGKVIDLGNVGDIDFADVLEYYEADPQTKVIFLHMEHLKDGRRFLEVARRVARKKPILALKVGRTGEGARVVASHTGALAGRDEVYDAAFRQCGIIRVRDMDEMEDLAKAFLYLPLMKGRGAAILAHVGGIKGIGTDAFIEHGLVMAQLEPQTLSQIQAMFPPWAPAGNPLDSWPAGMAHGYLESTEHLARAVLADRNVAGLLFVVWAMSRTEYHFWDASPLILRASADFPDKPICVWGYGPDSDEWRAAIEGKPGVMWYPTPERAARALAALYRRWRFLDKGQP
ncbi:MAG: acetate--CoA ligase family protein [Dehalococcoidia bacterium]